MEPLNLYLTTLSQAQSLTAVWEQHCARMAGYGFASLIYGFTPYVTPQSFGDPQDWVVHSNHPGDYLKDYIGGGHYLRCPAMRWAMKRHGHISWGVIAAQAMAGEFAAEEVAALEFSQNYGVTAGYSLSFASASRRARGGMALIGAPDLTQEAIDAIWQAHSADIEICCTVAHLKVLNLPHIGNRQLSKRQREVLEWVALGKTAQEIARLMDLTPATVEKHLRMARVTLDVQTTAQAIVKAAQSNLIFVEEPYNSQGV